MAKKKTSKRKTTTKKKASKKVAKKKTVKKKAAKSASKKKTAGKASSSRKQVAAGGKKKAAKSAANKATKAATGKKKAAKKVAAKKTKKAGGKKKTTKKAAAANAEAPVDAKPKKLKLVLAQPVMSGKNSRPRTVKPPVSSLPVSEAREPLTQAQLRKVKTDLTRSDKERLRRKLLEKRNEIRGDVENLKSDSRNNTGDVSHVPVHMADVGTDNFEQEFTLGLVETEQRLLGEIDMALTRMKDGTYGVCIETGVPIGKERLEAKPWAKYCIEVVRERERLGKST